MYSKFLIFVIIILTVPIMAQPNLDNDMHSLRVSPLSASYTYEKSITNEFKVLSNGTLSIMPILLFGSVGVDVFGRISIEPRLYYNLEERQNNGKSTRNNAANYLSFSVNYFRGFRVLGPTNGKILLGPKWGIRRNIVNNIYFETNAGFGIFTTPPYHTNIGFLPMGSLEVG